MNKQTFAWTQLCLHKQEGGKKAPAVLRLKAETELSRERNEKAENKRSRD